MADIHVLAGNGRGWQIVMHLAVPDTTNAVGVNHRTAMVNSGIGGSTVLTEGTGPGQITTAEKALIEAGELYEVSELVSLDGSGVTQTSRRAALQALHVRRQSAEIARLQERLKYFGYIDPPA